MIDTPIDVPLVNGITINGNPDDWGDRGFRVDLLGDASGKVKTVKDFDPRFRLAWDARDQRANTSFNSTCLTK